MIDKNLFAPFIQGTAHVLKVQCFTECTPKAIVPKMQFKNSQSIEIAGVAALTSPKHSGSLSICFPAKVFLDLMGKMLGETFPALTPDLEDGVAEITNLIFGHAKTILNNNGYMFEKSIPTTIRGEHIHLKHTAQEEAFVATFVTPTGEFYLELSIKTK